MRTDQPKIAFCTTCKGRTQHIEKTLHKNIGDNLDYPNCKFVVLDYNSQDGLKSYINRLAPPWSGDEWPNWLSYYHFPDPQTFHMAHAKNMAHRLGMLEGADILVNLDADNYTGPGFASYIAQQFSLYGPNTFLWAKMIKEGPLRTARGISGRIVCTSKAFVKSGGYDEQFSTWSPDDKDFNIRLQRLGYHAKEIDRQYLDAVPHTDKMRFREYPDAALSGGEDDFEAVHASETTVANFGNFGCGSVYRNFSDTPTVLAPLPTRIFGIGMHKTATTSLHHALKILGYESAHWMSAHWAKQIWEEMNTWGRSITLEHHYAMCDLPFTLLYEKLDKAYPGSKFILTVRNEKDWLRSVERHWSHEYNQFRAGWSTDPFTHRVHKLLYGQKGFDAELFLARYHRHNDEVEKYFQDRPGDLHILNTGLSSEQKWVYLCRFLNKPVPTDPFPVAFATDGRSL